MGLLALLLSPAACRFGYSEVLGGANRVDARDAGVEPPDPPGDGDGDADGDGPLTDAGEDAGESLPDAGLSIEPEPDAGPGITQVTFSAGGSTAQIGGTGGAAFSEDCPAGHALVGYRGYLSASYSWLTRTAGVCARVIVEADARASWIDEFALPEHASDGDMYWERLCARGEVVVGFEGHAGQYLDQLTFHCAPLTVSGQAGSYELGLGSARPLAAIGQVGGEAFALQSCPAGEVATGHQGRSGNWFDALGLHCSTPSPE